MPPGTVGIVTPPPPVWRINQPVIRTRIDFGDRRRKVIRPPRKAAGAIAKCSILRRDHIVLIPYLPLGVRTGDKVSQVSRSPVCDRLASYADDPSDSMPPLPQRRSSRAASRHRY